MVWLEGNVAVAERMTLFFGIASRPCHLSVLLSGWRLRRDGNHSYGNYRALSSLWRLCNYRQAHYRPEDAEPWVAVPQESGVM